MTEEILRRIELGLRNLEEVVRNMEINKLPELEERFNILIAKLMERMENGNHKQQ